MRDEVNCQENMITIENISRKTLKKAYRSPELIRFGAVSDLTASGSNFEKEENTGQDCDNNATRNGMQPCTKI